MRVESTTQPQIPIAEQVALDAIDNSEVIGTGKGTEQIFTRILSDGREVSGTAEQAIKICPVLGQMSLENAQSILAQQDIADRMAQRGREIRLAEEAKATVSNDEPTPRLTKDLNVVQSAETVEPDKYLPQPVADPTVRLAIMQATSEQIKPIETDEISQVSLAKVVQPEPEVISELIIIERPQPEPATAEPKLTVRPKLTPQAVVQPMTSPKETRAWPEIVTAAQPKPEEAKTLTIKPEAQAKQSKDIDREPAEPILSHEIGQTDLSFEIADESIVLEVLPTGPNTESEPEVLSVETIVEHIVTDIEIESIVFEQVTVLVEALPEVVQTTLVDYIEHVESEIVEPVEELIVEMALAADRLHELVVTDQLDSSEAEQIQELLVEQYVELLSILEIDIDEELINALIQEICSESHKTAIQVDQNEFRDILRERRPKHHFDIPNSLISNISGTAVKIARLLGIQRDLLLTNS